MFKEVKQLVCITKYLLKTEYEDIIHKKTEYFQVFSAVSGKN